MDIEIYPMTQQDFNIISPILSTEFDDFWTVSALKSELENSNSSYIVAKLNFEIVGFAGIWRSVDEVHIMDIVVKKKLSSSRNWEKIIRESNTINKKKWDFP